MKKRRWTTEEDKIVTHAMMAHIIMGKTMHSSYEQLSNELGRSFESVRSRWKNVLKPQYEDKINVVQEIINKNGLKSRTYKKWTTHEKNQLRNTVNKYTGRGRTIESALRYFSKKQKRTFRSVYKMWYANLHVKNTF